MGSPFLPKKNYVKKVNKIHGREKNIVLYS